MTKKYRVITCNKRVVLDENAWYVAQAELLAITYGLFEYYDLPEILALWRQYSEDMNAGWMNDDPESIERVFGVELEEE